MDRSLDRRSFLSLLALLFASPAFAQFKIPGIGGLLGGQGDSGGEGGGEIGGRADIFQKFVAYGTRNLLLALGEVGIAVGRREEAAHYAAVADTFKQGSISEDTFRTAKPMIAESTVKPEDIVLARAADAREQLRSSFIHFSLGSFMDKKASTAAQALLQAKPSAAELANRTVSGAIAVAKVAKDALPVHLATAAKWLGALTAYMKANKIPVPTNAEIKKIAQKEAGQQNLLADFPAD
jgi:hypothetical protein